MEKWNAKKDGFSQDSYHIDSGYDKAKGQYKEEAYAYTKENADLIVTLQNQVAEIANKYGSAPQQVAKQIVPAIELLMSYIGIVGNTGYMVDREAAKMLWDKGQEILSAIRSK